MQIDRFPRCRADVVCQSADSVTNFSQIQVELQG
jgi:hypothetical protein